MSDLFSLTGARVTGASPHLGLDRIPFDALALTQAPELALATGQASAEINASIPSFDDRGRPRLVTGAQAAAAASAIAAGAWEPSDPDNRTTGRPGEGVRPYVGLAELVGTNGSLDVVGAYGEIVFVADPNMSRAAQAQYVEQAVAEAENTPTGRRLLNGLAGDGGLPILVRLNDQRANVTDFPEDPNAIGPEGDGEPAVRLRSNYDLIYWDPTSAPVSDAGHAAPPVTILIHELLHAEQYATERERLPASADFPDGLIRQPVAYHYDDDADRNGIKDREDEATMVENRFLRELGLEPLRERYDSGIVGFIEVSGADEVPTDQEIREFLMEKLQGNRLPRV